MDAIFDFVKHFTRVRYEDLPIAAVEAVKNEVLDSLATAIGGCSKAGVGELVDLIKEWGGTEQSSLIEGAAAVRAALGAEVLFRSSLMLAGTAGPLI